MSDYIRREDAVDDLHTQLMYRMGSDDMKRRLDDWVKTLPSADVVQVVRCDDCEYYGSRRWCELHSSVFDDNAFCSYGERKE